MTRVNRVLRGNWLVVKFGGMKLADFPSVAALSAVEKLQLADEIWASIGAGLNSSAVSPEEKKDLDERWATYERNPESAITLQDLQKGWRSCESNGG